VLIKSIKLGLLRDQGVDCLQLSDVLVQVLDLVLEH
jgi:hypothetical protein